MIYGFEEKGLSHLINNNMVPVCKPFHTYRLIKMLFFVLGYYENRFVHLREMDGKTVVAPSTVAKGCGKSLKWFIKVWKPRNFGGEGH